MTTQLAIATKNISALALFLFLSSSYSHAKSLTATFDHGNRTWTCNGASGMRDCALKAHEGDSVTVTVINTLPGLFSVEITQDLKEVVGIDSGISGKFGIPSGVAPTSTSGGVSPAKPGPNEPPPPPDPHVAYDALLAKLRDIRGVLLGDFSRYEAADQDLTDAHATLLSVLTTNGMPANTTDASAALTILNAKKVPLGMSEDQFKVMWDQVNTLLAIAPVRRTDGPSATFTYDDRDFDVTIVIKALSPLIQNPQISTKAVVQLKGAWKVSTTTGFAISGLRDDHYTTTTETTGTGTTVNKAVREERDVISIPEVTLFLHVYPQAQRFAFSAGIGVAAEASGRMYLGCSYRLGRAGALTFGVAGGKVKRLSKNVNVDDLGEVDPEAARRDVYRGSFLFGYSWTLTGK